MRVAAIDQGTTSTRCLVIGDGGAWRVAASRRHGQHHPHAGWVEHDPEELLANIRAVLEVSIADKREREYRLDALLEEFHIAHLRKSPSIALSGGERRRCEIARALATQPSFMLLDEPFAGVDPIAVGDIQDLVRHLTRRGIGVLITDHNVRETLGLIDRAYIINEGRVLTHGSPEEIVANEQVRQTYLGEQFTL